MKKNSIITQGMSSNRVFGRIPFVRSISENIVGLPVFVEIRILEGNFLCGVRIAFCIKKWIFSLFKNTYIFNKQVFPAYIKHDVSIDFIMNGWRRGKKLI